MIDCSFGWETFLDTQGDSEEELHDQIRRLVIEREFGKAMTQAVALFGFYRRRGQAPDALRLARQMRRLDLLSHIPYELELRLLVDIGRVSEAARVSQQLGSLQAMQGRPQEERACALRFELLTRPRQTWIPRPQRLVEIAPPLPPPQTSHLPALLEDDD